MQKTISSLLYLQIANLTKRFPFQQYFWRVKQSGHLIDQGMPKITGMFNELPANFLGVDAVYEGNSGTKYSGITIFISK